MVKEYNAWARVHGYPAEKMRAYHLNLLDPHPEGGIEVDLNLSRFNVVVICMALRHVADAERLLARLAGADTHNWRGYAYGAG